MCGMMKVFKCHPLHFLLVDPVRTMTDNRYSNPSQECVAILAIRSPVTTTPPRATE